MSTENHTRERDPRRDAETAEIAEMFKQLLCVLRVFCVPCLYDYEAAATGGSAGTAKGAARRPLGNSIPSVLIL